METSSVSLHVAFVYDDSRIPMGVGASLCLITKSPCGLDGKLRAVVQMSSFFCQNSFFILMEKWSFYHYLQKYYSCL
jgi:hypothetical protein